MARNSRLLPEWGSRRSCGGDRRVHRPGTSQSSLPRRGRVGFALGLGIGRIGDVINGEHYGPASDFFLAVRNTHPQADTPDPAIAYHSGGLYGVLLGTAIFALLWPLHRLFSRPTMLLWAVLTLYAFGRLVESFFRLDSPALALGLSGPQWTSVLLLLVAGAGALCARRRFRTREGEPREGAAPESARTSSDPWFPAGGSGMPRAGSP